MGAGHARMPLYRPAPDLSVFVCGLGVKALPLLAAPAQDLHARFWPDVAARLGPGGSRNVLDTMLLRCIDCPTDDWEAKAGRVAEADWLLLLHRAPRVARQLCSLAFAHTHLSWVAASVTQLEEHSAAFLLFLPPSRSQFEWLYALGARLRAIHGGLHPFHMRHRRAPPAGTHTSAQSCMQPT
jgi:hypothetical protein